MAKFLQGLLGASEPLFSESLRQLEKASGHKGVDVRLIADITHSAHAAMRELGLTPADTTGRELYHALLGRVRRDNERLAARLGGNDADDTYHMAPLVIKAAVDSARMPKVWVLKRGVVAGLLRETPPVRLLKHLGYETVDELLKEDIYNVYAVLRFSEGASWLTQFNETLQAVSPDDFEQREIIIRQLDGERYGALAADFVRQRGHNIVHCKEFGVIAIAPAPQVRMPGATLTMLLFVLHYLNEIQVYSTFFRLQRTQPNFGEMVAQAINNDLPTVNGVAGQKVHWRTVQKYFGSNEAQVDELQPHLNPEDLRWQKAEDLLCEIDAEMGFWRGREYVGLMYDNVPVSLNLLDVVLAYGAEVSYEQRRVRHLRESLWNELYGRYLGEEGLQRQALLYLGISN